jgi:hypothetical protein
MQFNSILLLLLCLISSVQRIYGQTCDCRSCSNTATVNPFTQFQASLSTPCSVGTAAAVSAINVQSTDGSGFEVYTRDDPSGSAYYVAGSTTSSVTCFKMGDGIVVGGQNPQIYVVIKCDSLFQPCKVRYSMRLTCVRIATTSTPKPTLSSTVKPVRPPTVPPVKVNNTCECQCCKGSSTCVPVYVGTIVYGVNKCNPSNCLNQCSRNFPVCLVNANQPGKVVTQCRNNAAITLKTPFYIPILILFFQIFNRI